MSVDYERVKLELAECEFEGTIKPADVLDKARDPATALHACFEWDDSRAADAHRMEQARRLIRVYVVSDPGNSEPHRAFVALRADRKTGGGYRTTASVMSDAELTRHLMREALGDLKAAKERYKRLQQLQRVFDAIDDAERDFEKQEPRAA